MEGVYIDMYITLATRPLQTKTPFTRAQMRISGFHDQISFARIIYNHFRALHTKRAAIERVLLVKSAQTFTNQRLEFKSGKQMMSLLIYGGTNHLKRDQEGEINHYSLYMAGII